MYDADNIVALLKQKPTARVDDDSASDLTMLRSVHNFSSFSTARAFFTAVGCRCRDQFVDPFILASERRHQHQTSFRQRSTHWTTLPVLQYRTFDRRKLKKSSEI
jgi:hypothetical protein